MIHAVRRMRQRASDCSAGTKIVVARQGTSRHVPSDRALTVVLMDVYIYIALVRGKKSQWA